MARGIGRRQANAPLAAAEARRLWETYGFREPDDLVVEDLAMALGVVVIEGPLSCADAWLVRHGERGIIRVKEDIPEPGRKRFAVCHELGHWVLHANISQILSCTNQDIRSNGYKNSPEEVEASTFASELLMNEKLFKARMRGTTLTWDAIRDVAEYFHTSLTATAMRYVDLCPDPCALVITRDARIKWFRSSDAFSERFRFHVKAAVGEKTAAFALTQSGAPLEATAEPPIDAWADAVDDGDEPDVSEQSIRRERYGDVASLICLE
jgi:Zn-dependent peptidase ImmA (M78 family)